MYLSLQIEKLKYMYVAWIILDFKICLLIFVGANTVDETAVS